MTHAQMLEFSQEMFDSSAKEELGRLSSELARSASPAKILEYPSNRDPEESPNEIHHLSRPMTEAQIAALSSDEEDPPLPMIEAQIAALPSDTDFDEDPRTRIEISTVSSDDEPYKPMTQAQIAALSSGSDEDPMNRTTRVEISTVSSDEESETLKVIKADTSTLPTIAAKIPSLSLEQDVKEETSRLVTATSRFRTSQVDMRTTSESYEADTEANASSPRTASMGPRAPWDTARADRNKRYAALQRGEIDEDVSTDEDSGFWEMSTSALPWSRIEASERKEEPILFNKFRPARQRRQEAACMQPCLPLPPLLPRGEERAYMLAAERLQGSSTKPDDTQETPVVPIDDYLKDKVLRQRLLDESKDFVLEETLNEQDSSTPKNRFLVTSQLDPNDPFEAALATFGWSNYPLRRLSSQSEDNTTSEDSILSESPQSVRTTESCPVTTHDPARSVPLPFPSLHIRSKPVRKTSGLINEIRRDSVSEKGTGDGHGESEAEVWSNMTAPCSPAQKNKIESSLTDEIPFDQASETASAFERVPAKSPDHWTKPVITYHSGRILSASAASTATENDPDRLSMENLEPCPSGLFVSRKPSSRSLNSSPHLRRGRSASRSFSNASQRRKARSLGRLPSGGYRIRSRSLRSLSGRNSQSRASSYASNSTSRSTNLRDQLEAHYYYLQEQIARDSGREQLKEPRQRLADVSMVERRKDLDKKASIIALCEFIYQCERESKVEEEKESEEEREESEEQSEKESNDGYTTAIFQGK